MPDLGAYYDLWSFPGYFSYPGYLQVCWGPRSLSSPPNRTYMWFLLLWSSISFILPDTFIFTIVYRTFKISHNAYRCICKIIEPMYCPHSFFLAKCFRESKFVIDNIEFLLSIYTWHLIYCLYCKITSPTLLPKYDTLGFFNVQMKRFIFAVVGVLLVISGTTWSTKFVSWFYLAIGFVHVHISFPAWILFVHVS